MLCNTSIPEALVRITRYVVILYTHEYEIFPEEVFYQNKLAAG